MQDQAQNTQRRRNTDNKSEAANIQVETYEELLGFIRNKIIPNKTLLSILIW